jgi:hypothetical protein
MPALIRSVVVCTLRLAAPAAALAGQDRDMATAGDVLAPGCVAPARAVPDTASLVIYVSALDTLADTARRSLAQLDAEALAESFQPPTRLTYGRWPLPWNTDATALERDTWARESGLTADVRLVVDPRGRLLEVSLDDSTAAPELNAAIVGAARRADSLGTFAPPVYADSTVVLPIHLSTDAGAGAFDAPLMRIELPYARITAPATVRHLSRPTWPPGAVPDARDGYVDLQFVVDEHGRARASTLTLVSARRAEFIAPAEDAVRQATFDAARSGTCAVRQLVQQRVWFRQPGDIDRARPSRPIAEGKRDWPQTSPARADRPHPPW